MTDGQYVPSQAFRNVRRARSGAVRPTARFLPYERRILRAVTAASVLDGTRIATLEDFRRMIGEAVNGPGGYFGRNLGALADCLGGGFGTPGDDGFVFEWRDHETSRVNLGHLETARQLELFAQRAPGALRLL